MQNVKYTVQRPQNPSTLISFVLNSGNFENYSIDVNDIIVSDIDKKMDVDLKVYSPKGTEVDITSENFNKKEFNEEMDFVINDILQTALEFAKKQTEIERREQIEIERDATD